MYKSATYKIIGLMFLSLCSFTIKSQDTINSTVVEKDTYTYYLQRDWSNLITLANKALKQNIDYYYLRVRLGIAYYNQKKYANAILHFQEARKQNSAEKLSLEYLYYALLKMERYDEAEYLTKQFDEELNLQLF